MGNIPRRRLKFDPSEEKVGYCRPPKHSQFKPGQCHSKGRPKGSRNFRNIIKSTLMKLLTVTRNGKTRKVPTIEALLLRELEKAFAAMPVRARGSCKLRQFTAMRKWLPLSPAWRQTMKWYFRSTEVG